MEAKPLASTKPRSWNSFPSSTKSPKTKAWASSTFTRRPWERTSSFGMASSCPQRFRLHRERFIRSSPERLLKARFPPLPKSETRSQRQPAHNKQNSHAKTFICLSFIVLCAMTFGAVFRCAAQDKAAPLRYSCSRPQTARHPAHKMVFFTVPDAPRLALRPKPLTGSRPHRASERAATASSCGRVSTKEISVIDGFSPLSASDYSRRRAAHLQ